MSAVFTTYAGLGVPSLDDTDYVTTFANTFMLLDGLSPIRDFAVKLQQNPSTTLNVVVNGGTVIKRDSTELVIAPSTKAMTASVSNYIFLDSIGVITVNTTGFPAGVALCPLAIVVAGLTSITSITDARRSYQLSGQASSSEYLLLAGGTMTGAIVLSGSGANAGLIFAAVAAPGSPTDGQHWYDTTNKMILGSVAGITARYASGMFRSTASATVANSVTETSILGTGVGITTAPANFFAAGKTVSVEVSGVLSTTGTPNITLRVKLGALVLTTGAVAAGSGVTNVGVKIEATITCRTAGASGTFIGQGMAWINNVAFPMTMTATTVLDSTTSLAVATTAEWSAAAAANTITGTNATIDIKN